MSKEYSAHMKTVIANKNTFIDLLKSTKREGIDKLIAFLEKNQFFTAPASVKYHNSFDGGLCDHSLKVHDILMSKADMYNLLDCENKEEVKNNIIISALLHDICKINNYENKINWRKDKNNKWESYSGYGYSENKSPLGHGSKSVITAQTFIKLSKVETYAIYWHMGAFEEGCNLHELSAAAKKYMLVILLHTADVESSYLLETDGVQEELIALP